MQTKWTLFASIVLVVLSLILTGCTTPNSEKFEANWDSLGKVNQTPDWFRDAKFGIYTHWGPVSEAFDGADPDRWYGGWHGMLMYNNGRLREGKEGKPSNNYLHHVEKYGDPAEFGYKHVIEQFEPSGFDAAEWADLFAKAGAKFAGPVAMHHDNFAMWDSKATR